MLRFPPLSGLASLLLMLLGCSGGIDKNYYRHVDDTMARGEFAELATEIRDSGPQIYGDRNRLLYHMDLAMMLHLAGENRDSNLNCHQGEQIAEDLFTRSMSGEFGSLLTSDLDLPYRGEDSEKVLLNLLSGINYAVLGAMEDALVEIRKVNARLQEFEAGHGKGRYGEDGFARLMAALLYLDEGELDDALVSIRRALALYQVPQGEEARTLPGILRSTAVEVARATGEWELLGLEPSAAGASRGPGEGSLVVVHLVGPGPRKEERFFQIALGNGMAFVAAADVRSDEDKDVQRALAAAGGLGSDFQVVVAYPVFHQPALAAVGNRLRVAGCGDAPLELVEDLTEISRINLEDRIERDRGRMIARAVLKILTAEAAGKVGKELANPLVGALTEMFTRAALSAAEAADTRSWQTLPARIELARLHCRPGTYELLLDRGGGYLGGTTMTLPGVQVRPGQTTWISLGSW